MEHQAPLFPEKVIASSFTVESIYYEIICLNYRQGPEGGGVLLEIYRRPLFVFFFFGIRSFSLHERLMFHQPASFPMCSINFISSQHSANPENKNT